MPPAILLQSRCWQEQHSKVLYSKMATGKLAVASSASRDKPLAVVINRGERFLALWATLTHNASVRGEHHP